MSQQGETRDIVGLKDTDHETLTHINSTHTLQHRSRQTSLDSLQISPAQDTSKPDNYIYCLSYQFLFQLNKFCM